MTPLILILFLGALTAAVALTPISKWLAPHVGVMDKPSARKIHALPVPRLGGVAILLAVMLALIILRSQMEIQQLVAIIFGAAFMSFLGLVDDRFTLSAYVRLAAQIGAALSVWFAGVRIQMFSIPWFDATLTVFWVVGITNAMNFLDNMDGLSAGISAIVSAFFLVLAVQNGQILVGMLSAALLGACVGFLFWNLNPAFVFMGDSGSMFLGFLLACVAIKLRFVGQTLAVSWMVPLITMGLPVFDTTLVFISRLRRGKNPLTTPGRDHTSHRITNHGFSRREAVLILYIACSALGLTAQLVALANEVAGIIIGALIFILACFMLWFLEFGPWRLNKTLDEPTTASQS
jgi:UDP-GlcNAc:undecaprenyl-phosphate/decaprenyl-phosphate GlcNAc-1-phosphate transferase